MTDDVWATEANWCPKKSVRWANKTKSTCNNIMMQTLLK